jgi:hypothetical protein
LTTMKGKMLPANRIKFIKANTPFINEFTGWALGTIGTGVPGKDIKFLIRENNNSPFSKFPLIATLPEHWKFRWTVGDALKVAWSLSGRSDEKKLRDKIMTVFRKRIRKNGIMARIHHWAEENGLPLKFHGNPREAFSRFLEDTAVPPKLTIYIRASSDSYVQVNYLGEVSIFRNIGKIIDFLDRYLKTKGKKKSLSAESNQID